MFQFTSLSFNSSVDIENFFAISANGSLTKGKVHWISFKISLSRLSLEFNVTDAFDELKNVTRYFESINSKIALPDH